MATRSWLYSLCRALASACRVASSAGSVVADLNWFLNPVARRTPAKAKTTPIKATVDEMPDFVGAAADGSATGSGAV